MLIQLGILWQLNYFYFRGAWTESHDERVKLSNETCTTPNKWCENGKLLS